MRRSGSFLYRFQPPSTVRQIRYENDFQRFILYTPAAGTPLYSQMLGQGRLLEDIGFAAMHLA